MERLFKSQIRAYISGEITPDEFAALQRNLTDNAEVREQFLHEVNLCAALEDLAIGERELIASRKSQFTSGEAIARSSRRSTALPFVAGSLLVLVGAVVTVLVLSPPAETPSGANARLAYVSGNVALLDAKGQSRDAATGMSIGAGERLETTGAQACAVISYEDQSEVLLTGDSDVLIVKNAPKYVSVGSGTLSATVAPQPPGAAMVIETPQARLDVPGTSFVLATANEQTDVKVADGRVKLTRVADGRSVIVGAGKRVVANQQLGLEPRDAAPPPETWQADFERGLPTDWRCGEFVTKNLPTGSRGAVRATGEGNSYSIIAPHAWMDGLFVVHQDSHLNLTFKMERPSWINIFLVTRNGDPKDPTTSLHKFGSLPMPARDVWYTASVPLSHFQNWTGTHYGDDPPQAGELAFALSWTAPQPDRGLVIDRAWVSRDGPGRVTLQRMEQ